MKLGDAKKWEINALKQVAHIWHCLMLGIVCFGKPHPRTGVPHLLLPTSIPCLDHLAMGVLLLGVNTQPILSPFTPLTKQPSTRSTC